MKIGKSRIRHAALSTGAALVALLTLSGGGPPGGEQPAPDPAPVPSAAGKGDRPHHSAPVGSRTIRVQAGLAVGEELDLGAPGRSVGDQFVFSGTLRSRAERRPVGRVGGFCVLDDLERNAGECSLTAVLDGAQLAVQGELAGIPAPGPATVAITGGTGRFREARGQMTLRVLTPSTWNLTFHVIGR